MLNNRRHMRIRDDADVRWTILGQSAAGEGHVINVSLSGMLLQTDARFDPAQPGLLYIDAHGAEPLPFGAKKGKVVWLRRIGQGKGYQCGVEFVDKGKNDKALIEWIDLKTKALEETSSASILNQLIS